jgi:hypothetical protein
VVGGDVEVGDVLAVADRSVRTLAAVHGSSRLRCVLGDVSGERGVRDLAALVLEVASRGRGDGAQVKLGSPTEL